MRINRELALDCPMAAQILNSSSRKKTELIVRLAEMQLKALGYSQRQLRDMEDIKFVIEMMDRGFINGCPASERWYRAKQKKGFRNVLAGKMRKEDDPAMERNHGNKEEDQTRGKEGIREGIATVAGGNSSDQETRQSAEVYPERPGNEREGADFRSDYLEAVRNILGEDEFGSFTEGE